MGRGNKDFKKGDKLGQGVGALKKGGGAGTPLRTMLTNKIKSFLYLQEKLLKESAGKFIYLSICFWAII